jgi:hypothetical protein
MCFFLSACVTKRPTMVLAANIFSETIGMWIIGTHFLKLSECRISGRQVSLTICLSDIRYQTQTIGLYCWISHTKKKYRLPSSVKQFEISCFSYFYILHYRDKLRIFDRINLFPFIVWIFTSVSIPSVCFKLKRHFVSNPTPCCVV